MKRTRKLILALVVVMSLLMAMAVAVIPASAASYTTLYFKPGSYWNVDGAVFRAWTWGGSKADEWIHFSDSDGDGIFEAQIWSDMTDIIFYRSEPGKTGWDGEWGRIQKSISSGKNCFTLSSYNAGSWSTYTPPCTNHNFSALSTDGYAATCTTAGKLNYKICSNAACSGKMFDEAGNEITNRTIPATGHNIVNGTCTNSCKKSFEGINISFKPGDWTSDNAIIAVYFFASDTGEFGWVEMTADEDIYSALIPNEFDKFILVRLDPAAASLSFDDKWNQTDDIKVADIASKCYAEFDTWDKGTNGNSTVIWASHTEGTAETCTTAQICTVCDAVLVEKLGHDYTITYTWSNDYKTCTASGVCKNDSNHTLTAETVNAVKAGGATCGEDGTATYTATFTTNAKYVVQVKNVDETATGNHTGGTATCTAQAECEVCGESYGSKNASNHASDTAVTPENGGTEKVHSVYECCGVTYSATHDTVETWSSNETHHWHECSCGYDIAKVEHTPGEDDGDCRTAITCSACSAVTTEGKASHTSSEDDGDVTTAVKCANEGCEHVFVEAKEAITLTIPTFENGAVTADKMNYAIGDTVTLTIAPNGGYFQKLYINGEPLMLGWKTFEYSFTATENAYEITGSFENGLNLDPLEWGRWDDHNQLHGVLNTYYPNHTDSWWMNINGEYQAIEITAKNYLPLEDSMDNQQSDPKVDGYHQIIRFGLSNGNTYAFRIYNDKGTYAVSCAGTSGSVAGWGNWKNIANVLGYSINDAMSGDGVKFKIERTSANVITVSVKDVVMFTYTMDGVTEDDKVVSVGIQSNRNIGKYVAIPFELTVPCDHNTADCPHKAAVDGKYFESFEAALAAVKTSENKTLVLNGDVEDTNAAGIDLTGITIDLNGHKLTAVGVIDFSGTGAIKDSSEGKAGRVVVSKGGIIGASNDYLPVWTGSDYIIADVTDQYKCTPDANNTVESNKYAVEFRPAFVGIAHFDKFANGSADEDITFWIRITRDSDKSIVGGADIEVVDNIVKTAYLEHRTIRLTLKNADWNEKYTIELVMKAGAQYEYVGQLGTINKGTYSK